MSIIGTFTKSGDTFTGTVKTLAFKFKAKLVPIEGGSDQAPAYRVYSDDAEIGAGWKKTSDNQREYISLKLDDPSLTNPIFASLFPGDDPDTYNLLWSRPRSN
ncbi:DUF736 domain-containing protein [Asticcacaulis taihuensis]|jgi:uncharacterized protein (DUF736 family)|uniref:Uncharacterized conserved protein, DUF736 family n=1 Tax=Asticcacaulis taihuensis TaxID=260084 RepID=A0A1G4PUV9_9CAUL|nr:DUF736 domain-containing protein [Asticcacaulis taihuensis]SCW35951.1 Uncharacterized conserved protein, DUF736 family [Asticcacaulis taihuensis]